MSKMKTRILLAILFIQTTFLGGRVWAESASFTLEPGVYTIQKDQDGNDRILMEGYTTAGSPGDPMLPSRVFNILVPPDVAWESLDLVVVNSTWKVLPERYSILAEKPDSTGVDGIQVLDWGENQGSLSEGVNLDVYEQDGFFPSEFAELLPYSQMRKWKFARVCFRPFQYNPVTGELKLIKSVRMEITYQRTGGTRSLAAMAHRALDDRMASDKVMDHLASTLFHNYASCRTAYAQAPGRIAIQGAEQANQAHDYVIITSNAIVSGSANLSAFVAHKEAHGHSVLVVTETDFDSLQGQAPNHRAEKIRQWLINNYINRGIEYVLLIGDPTPYETGEGDVPMKMCWPRLGSGQYEESPTDAFYADLTGNWDLNGNGSFGEWSDYAGLGGVDFSMEVWVGRIPVYNADHTTLDNILQKIMNYENTGSAVWRNNVLLPMSFSDKTYDGAPLAEQIRDDFLSTRGYNSWTQYQQGSGACSLDSVYSSNEELRGGTVVSDRWAANPYGIVAWWGHGSVTSTIVGAGGCWDDNLFSSSHTSSLNDDTPAFTYQCSCTNGYPEDSSNLQYALLRRGGVGTVSATRVSWYNTGVGYGQFDGSSTNAGIGYEYVDRLTQGIPAGRALFEAKLSVVPDMGVRTSRLMNQYDFNLYGDPSVGIGGCEADEECDDGLWCNGTETCENNRCEQGVPVNCDDGSACTDDVCNEAFERCDHSCNAAGPDDLCCENSACEEEGMCNEECIDEDGDGYGNPASINCTYSELDCNDSNPKINPGMTEVKGNEIDEDCSPDTTQWGTPASVLGEEYSRSSDMVNYFALLMVPAGVLMVRKRFRGA